MLTKVQNNAVIDAFLRALPARSYAEISLRSLAQDAKVPLARLVMAYASKLDLIEAYAARVDEAVLAGDDPDMAGEPARERLFDVLMRRYDALLADRPALVQLEKDARRDPVLAMNIARIAAKSMRRMAASAHLDVEGARGALVLAGMLQVHRSVLAVWLAESDEGQAQTMAELDRALRQAERRIGDLDRTASMLGSKSWPDLGREGVLCRLRARMMGRSNMGRSTAQAETA